MAYHFDMVIDRKNTNCLKWDKNDIVYGTHDIHPMWIADMDFKAPPEIISAMQSRLDHGVYGYTFRGEAYHNAIMSWVQRRYNWDIEKDWITFSPGVVPALSMSLLSNTMPGDRIIVMSPVYGPFFSVIKNNGRVLIDCPLNRDNEGYYTIDFDRLESMIDSRTKMMFLCNPHNPIGKVWSKDELEKLAEIALRNDLIIVSDEIHADFIYPGHRHIPIASLSQEIANRTISCFAPSKTFGLAGLSTSYAVIPNSKIRERFNDVLTALEIDGGNIFGHVALTAAYTQCEPWLEELLVYLESNRNYACQYMKERIPQVKANTPEATYLLWLDCQGLGFENDKQLDAFFVSKAKLGCNRGVRFGGNSQHFMRLNFACPRSLLEQGLNCLEKAVNSVF